MAKFLLVTDLDNTLVGDDPALEAFKQRFSPYRERDGALLVYSTGRSRVSYEGLKAAKQLLEPDALVTAVGTEIYWSGSDAPDPNWSAQLQQNWDRDCVVATTAHFADLMPQPDLEQRPFKVSFYLTQSSAVEVLPQLKHALIEQHLQIKLVYSGGKDLDILPVHGDKGAALVFLRQQLGMAADHTVACGDSGNDQALFRTGEEHGIIVGNAQPELLKWHHENPSQRRYLAQAHYASGILEGLHHFNLLP